VLFPLHAAENAPGVVSMGDGQRDRFRTVLGNPNEVGLNDLSHIGTWPRQ